MEVGRESWGVKEVVLGCGRFGGDVEEGNVALVVCDQELGEL